MSRESVLNPPVSTCLVRVVTTRQGRRHGCRPHWDDDLKSLKSTPKDSYSVFYNQEKVSSFGKKNRKNNTGEAFTERDVPFPKSPSPECFFPTVFLSFI